MDLPEVQGAGFLFQTGKIEAQRQGDGHAVVEPGVVSVGDPRPQGEGAAEAVQGSGPAAELEAASRRIAGVPAGGIPEIPAPPASAKADRRSPKGTCTKGPVKASRVQIPWSSEGELRGRLR